MLLSNSWRDQNPDLVSTFIMQFVFFPKHPTRKKHWQYNMNTQLPAQMYLLSFFFSFFPFLSNCFLWKMIFEDAHAAKCLQESEGIVFFLRTPFLTSEHSRLCPEGKGCSPHSSPRQPLYLHYSRISVITVSWDNRASLIGGVEESVQETYIQHKYYQSQCSRTSVEESVCRRYWGWGTSLWKVEHYRRWGTD